MNARDAQGRFLPSADSFMNQLDRAFQELEEHTAETFYNVATWIYREVVLRTPVDEGPTREAWSIDWDYPFVASQRGEVGNTGIEQRKRFDSPIWITNGQPNAVVLEFGLFEGIGPKTTTGSNILAGSGIFSSQAPQGMLYTTLNDFRLNARQVAEGGA